MPVTSPGCYLYFWPTGYKSELPTSPFLGSINLPEWLTELRKHCTYYITSNYKRNSSETIKWKRYQYIEQRMGKKLSCPLCVLYSPQISMCSSNLEALQTESFWVFMEASLHRHNWLNHWQLAIDWTLPLLPSQEVRGLDWNFQPSNHMVGSSPHPWVLSENHLINITKDTFVTLIT